MPPLYAKPELIIIPKIHPWFIRRCIGLSSCLIMILRLRRLSQFVLLWPKEEKASSRAPVASRRRVTNYRLKRGGGDATTTPKKSVPGVLLTERRHKLVDHQRFAVHIPSNKNARHVEDVSSQTTDDSTHGCDVAMFSSWIKFFGGQLIPNIKYHLLRTFDVHYNSLHLLKIIWIRHGPDSCVSDLG